MKILESFRLDEYDSEDVLDVVKKLETSFNIQFADDAFLNVNTFGDLCDVFHSCIAYNNEEDCTKQQAFYKIRAAISVSQRIDRRSIDLETRLVDLFPVRKRRREVRHFQKQLGIDLDILTYPGWLAIVLVVGLLSSFIALFFDFTMAISGTVFFLLAMSIANRTGTLFITDTVRELTEKAVREHYIETRRSSLSVNRSEITATIVDAFSSGLGIDKGDLTREAKFSWAE